MIAGLTWRCVTRRGSRVHLVSDPFRSPVPSALGWRWGKTLCGQWVYELVRAKAGDERVVSCVLCRRVAEGVVAFEARTVAALLEGRR